MMNYKNCVNKEEEYL